jgi:hypothetical protein
MQILDYDRLYLPYIKVPIKVLIFATIFFLISGVGLWVLRPLLAYCASPG